MLRDEQLATVTGRKQVAGIESQPQRRDMSAQRERGLRIVRTRLPLAELRVGCVALVAIRVAKVHSGLRRVVQFIARHVIPHQVPAVVGQPEFCRIGMKGQANAVPEPLGIYLHATAISRYPPDLRISGLIANIARRAEGYVEQTVRAKAQVLPSVMGFIRKSIADNRRLGRLIQPVLDIVVTQDTVHRADIKRTLPEFDAGRHTQIFIHQVDMVGNVIAITIHYCMYLAGLPGACKHGALVAQSELPRVLYSRCVDIDTEPFGQFNQRKLVRNVTGGRQRQ